jgi:hypothetical protein
MDIPILFVENDPNACKEFVDCLGEEDDISLIGITNSSMKALDYVLDL